MHNMIRDRSGAVAVEFALILPAMLLLAGAIFGIGSVLRAYAATNRLTMEYAISYANCSDTASGVCQTELNQYGTAAALGNVAPRLTASNITLSMAQVIMNGSTLSVEYAYPSSLLLSAAQQSALQAILSSGETGVVVSVTYQYQVPLFAAILAPIIGSSFTISDTVAQLK